jgi:hypothetical protein
VNERMIEKIEQAKERNEKKGGVLREREEE